MKKFTFFIALLFFLCSSKIQAQVTVTAPTLNNLCVGASTYTALGDIVITETAITDINVVTNQTLVFTMPTGFELQASTGTVAVSGSGDITSISSVISTTNITITYTADGTLLNAITISGLQVKATGTAGTSHMLFDATSTGTVAGMPAGTTVASFTSVAVPTISVLPVGATTICAGSQILFIATGNATQYRFEVLQGATSINTQNYSATFTYSTPTSLTANSYTLQVLGKNTTTGCESVLSTTPFTVVAQPALPAITGGSPKSYCVGTNAATTTISATGSGTLRWYSDISLITQVATGTSATLATLGVSTASASSTTFYITNDNATCESVPTPLVVNITALPTLSVFPSATNVCEGNTITFIGSASGTGIQYEFVLKKGGVTQITQAYSVTPFYTTNNTLVAGNDYTMEVLAKDASGCISALNTTAFTILANPTAPTIASATVTYCVGTNLASQTLTVTGITGGNTVEWFSDASLTTVLATGASVSVPSLSVSSASLNVYTRYVTQKDANCRSIATLVTIQISPNPTIALSSSRPSGSSICEGDGINFLGSGGLTYSFALTRTSSGVGDPLGAVETTTFSATNTYTIPTTLSIGNYFVRVTGTNSASCQALSNVITFSVLSKPSVSFPTPTPSSFSDSQTTPVTLSATPVPVAGETGVFSGPGVSGNQFYPNASGGAGSKTITYTFTSANGCSDSKSITLNINTAGFFIGQGYCQDDTPSPLVSFGTCGLITGVTPYFPAPAGSIVNPSSGVYNFVPSAMTIPAGQDYVLWEGAVYTQNCIAYYISTKVFRPATPVITGTSTLCKDNTVTYTVPAHTFATGVAGNVAYTWSFDTSGALVDGTIMGGQGTNTVTVKWNNAGSAKLQISETINYTSPVTTSCSKNATFDVTVNPLPTSTITSPGGAVCQGSTVVYSTDLIAGHTYSWSVTNGVVLSNPTPNSVQVQWNDISGFPVLGTVSVLRTITATGCQNTNSVNVNLQPLPNPVWSAGSNVVCSGDVGKVYTVAPAVPGNTYTWSISPSGAGSITSGNGTNSITINWGTVVSATAAVLQVVQKNNATNCQRTQTQNILINPLPTNTITSTTGGASSVCEDSEHTYQTPNGIGLSYTWSVTNGTIVGVSTADKVIVRWASGVTSGTLNLVKTNIVTGCINSGSLNVTINPLPTPLVIGASPVCALTTNVLYQTVQVVGSSYVWEVRDTDNNIVPFTVVSGNPHQITVNWGSTVTGRVKVTETTASGCTNLDSKNIAINPLPIPFILGSPEVCANTGGTNYITPSVAGNSYSWTITGGTITSGAGTNNIVVTWGNAGAGTLVLTETNTSTTCAKTVSQAVTIRPLPTPSIIGAVSVCRSQTGVTYSVTNVPMHIYQWNVVGGIITAGANTNSITVSWGTGASGTVQVQEIDGTFSTNCLASDTKTITINPLPAPVIVGTTIVCAGASGQVYTTTATAGHSYVWTVTGGTITSGAGTNSIVVDWGANPAGAQVQVVQTDNNFATNCNSTAIQPIVIQPLPAPNITPTANTCIGSTVTYQTPSVGGASYLWSVTNGSIISGQSTNTIVVEWNDTGASGTISVTQTLSSSCNSSDAKTINFYPLPTPSIAGSALVCENSVAPVAYSTASVAGSTYAWVVTGGTFSAGANPYQINVLWGGDGTGTVAVTETNSNGCINTNTKTVTIKELPNPVITPNNAVCENSVGNTYQVTNNVGSTYSWTVTGGNATSATNTNSITVNWSLAGTGGLQVTETDINGCQTTATRNITINPLPLPVVLGSLDVCENQTNVIYSTPNVAGHTYDWSVGGGAIIGSNTGNSITVNWQSYALTGGSGIVYIEEKNTATGCTDFNYEFVSIKESPNPTITGNAIVCALTNGEIYTVPAVAGHSYAWTVTGGTITAGAGTNSITVNWGSNPLGALVSVAQTDNNFSTNCSKTVTQNVTIHALPTPAITPTTGICEETINVLYQTTFITGSNYVWEVTGGTFTVVAGNPNQILVTWGLASAVAGGIGSIKVTETNANNCVKVVTQDIQIYAKPNPNIAVSPICESSAGNIYQTTNTAGSSFVWTVAGGVITNQNGSQITVQWNTIAQNTIDGVVPNVKVVETNGNGCVREVNQNIILRPLPAPAIVGNAVVCAFSTQNYSSILVSSHAYEWVVTGGTIVGSSTNNTVIVDWGGNPAFAKVQLKQTDNNFSNACYKIIEVPITINPLPNPAITPTTAVCEQSVGVEYQTTNIIGRNYVWTVTGGIITSGQNTNKITVNWGLASAVAGVGKVKVIETNIATSCKDSTLVNITLNPLPNPSVTPATPVCELSTGNVYQTANTAGSTFFWSVAGGVITEGQSTNQIKVSWNPTDIAGSPSTRIITIRETNNNGCVRTIAQNIIVNPRPAPVITGSLEVCALQNGVTYQTNAIPGNTYLWNVVGGNIVGSNSNNTVTIDWLSNPIGASVQVLETVTATGCSKPIAQNIIIRPLPNPVIAGSNAVCAQTPNSVYQVNNLPNQTYTWSVSNPTDNTIVSGQGTNSIVVNWGSNPGANTVTVTQTDNNFATNCATTKVLNVTVLPLPTPSITGDLVVCGSETNIPNSANFYEITYTTPLAANSSYLWEVSGNGIIMSGQLTNQIKVRWIDPSLTTPVNTTTGTVKVTQETTSPTPFCIASDTKTVTIHALPITTFSISNLCFGEATTFTPTITNPNWSWQWTFSEGSPSNVASPVVTFPTVGLKTLALSLIDITTGCQYDIDTTFRIHPVPVAKFSYKGSCMGATNAMQFTDSSMVATPDNIVHWSWRITRISDNVIVYTTAGNNPSVHKNPSYVFTQNGFHNVELTVTTNNNCSHTIVKKVAVFPTVVPTVATPYTQDFQTDSGGWLTDGTNNTWERGVPASTRTVKVTGADIVWTTALNNGINYQNNQKSYIESPCFDLSALDKPMIALEMWTDADTGNDGANILYTVNDGATWQMLGEKDKGVNWYNAQNILGFPTEANNPLRAGWTGRQGAWKSARYNLDAVKTAAAGNTVRFRITFGSNSDNPAGIFDGFAFDDVFIGNRQTTALVEHFTSMQASLQTENEAVNNLSNEAVKLQYHTNLSDNSSFSDKLYKDNTADPTARALLYGLTAVPRASVNGIVKRDSAFSIWGAGEVERQILGTPAFEMNIAFLPTPTDKLNIQVNVNPKINYTEDVVLHIVLVEKQITATQLGLTGTTIYKNVVKKMLPSAAGKTLRIDWTAGISQKFVETVTPYSLSQSTSLAPKFYDWNNVKVVAFIQDFKTNAVLQAVEATPTIIPSPITALADEGQGDCSIYPNPAENQVFIGFEESAFRTYNWEIITLQGQAIAKGTIQKGERGAKIDTHTYPSGMYIVKISHPQNKAYWTGKLVIKK